MYLVKQKLTTFFLKRCHKQSWKKKSSKLRNGFTIHTAKQKRGGYNSKIFFFKFRKINKTQITNRKAAQVANRHFTGEEIWMTNKYQKYRGKIHDKIYYNFIKANKIPFCTHKFSKNLKRPKRCGTRGTHCLGGRQLGKQVRPLWRTIWHFLIKLNFK